jgi:hypothetical protein
MFIDHQAHWPCPSHVFFFFFFLLLCLKYPLPTHPYLSPANGVPVFREDVPDVSLRDAHLPRVRRGTGPARYSSRHPARTSGSVFPTADSVSRKVSPDHPWAAGWGDGIHGYKWVQGKNEAYVLRCMLGGERKRK